MRHAGCLAILSLFALSLPARAQTAAPAETPAIRYRAVLVEGPRTIAALRRDLGPDGFAIVLKVNRLDLAHVRQGATLVVPDRLADVNLLTPFPRQLDAVRSPDGRLLLVSRRVQAFAAYDDRRLVRWGPTSTGRRQTPTPEGLFHTNWKSKLRRSTDNAEWLLPWYVNFDNARGVSFHQFDLPGYPASHACVRLLDDDARWVYEWAESWTLADSGRTIVAHGTPVVVFGDYADNAPAPWTRLVDDSHATDVAVSEIDAALAPHLTIIAARAQERERRPIPKPAPF